MRARRGVVEGLFVRWRVPALSNCEVDRFASRPPAHRVSQHLLPHGKPWTSRQALWSHCYSRWPDRKDSSALRGISEFVELV